MRSLVDIIHYVKLIPYKQRCVLRGPYGLFCVQQNFVMIVANTYQPPKLLTYLKRIMKKYLVVPYGSIKTSTSDSLERRDPNCTIH
jgi:hypothetical protein